MENKPTPEPNQGASKGSRTKVYKSQTQEANKASEPITAYASPAQSLSILLKQATQKPEGQMTAFEKMEMIREGISKQDLEHLKNKTALDYNQLSKLLSVARATLINKKGQEKFDNNLSEKIVGLAEIYSLGYDVFEDEQIFNNWIFRENAALGGQTPFDFLDNQYGREEVKNIIGRINYGVYS